MTARFRSSRGQRACATAVMRVVYSLRRAGPHRTTVRRCEWRSPRASVGRAGVTPRRGTFGDGQEHDLGEHADDIAARSGRARHDGVGKTARPEIPRGEQGPESPRATPLRLRRAVAAWWRLARRLPGGRL